jgi:2-hydroxy-6-oxonona-2,4-dienedioate hydrolase/4,5:9,10-diseco-3-hydroxy-5,9,17-trioxoandrosta-1(10),2-diene-4-oate hydrolase
MVNAEHEPVIVETSEAGISYYELGNGPALLCLHEGSPGAEGSSFEPTALDLAERFRVVVPDQPGFGDSTLRIDEGRDYQSASAAAMAELLAHLGIERANLLGNSLGAGVALTMALDHPNLVDRLVLIAPWTAGVAAPRSSLPRAVRLLLNYYPQPTLEKMRELVDALVHEAPGPDAGLVEARYEATLVPEHEQGFLRTLGPGSEGMAKRLATIDHDVLLLWGRDDAFCPIEDALLYLELLRNSRLVLFPRCGHSVHLERPPDFRAQVCAFLEA